MIHFILSRINYLQYYIPLILEAHKNSITSSIYLSSSHEIATNPSQYPIELKSISERCNVKILDIKEIVDTSGFVFFCEGDIVGRKHKDIIPKSILMLNSNHIKVSLVCNYEVVMFYQNYIKYVDYVIFPYEYMAKFYNLDSPKNLYLGSPKYDIEMFNITKICCKYNLLKQRKYMLVIYPKNPIYHHKKNTLYPSRELLLKSYEVFRKLGYHVIVKSRKQDAVTDPMLQGDVYIEDLNHFPCNSLELIYISEFVLYFSSSINEECAVLNKPYIDIKVDMVKDRFPYLNGKNAAVIGINFITMDNLESILTRSVEYFKKTKPEHVDTKMLPLKNSSKNIIDWMKTFSIDKL